MASVLALALRICPWFVLGRSVFILINVIKLTMSLSLLYIVLRFDLSLCFGLEQLALASILALWFWPWPHPREFSLTAYKCVVVLYRWQWMRTRRLTTGSSTRW